MKDEKIIKYLKDANLWRENNLYFLAMVPVSLSNQKSIYGIDVLAVRYCIVNKNENGIAIIPFDETLKCISQLITMIPHANIKEVYTEKYKSMLFISGVRLIIKTNDNRVVELEYPAKEKEKFLSSNMYKFVSEYKNKNEDRKSYIEPIIKNKEDGIMKIDFILKEEININNELYCKMEITNNKKIKEDIKELYSNKILEYIQTGKTKIYFYAETLPNDNKTVKITTEALSEALFDMSWYFEDNYIKDNNFEVIIIAEDHRTQDLYRIACKKMGLI